GRVYSYGISSRYYWQVVPAVRSHDCYLGHHLRIQRALAEPGTCSHAAPPAKENPWSGWLVFRSIQSCLCKRKSRLREFVACRDSKGRPQFRLACRGCDRCRSFWIAVAEQLSARRRSGLHLSSAAVA